MNGTDDCNTTMCDYNIDMYFFDDFGFSLVQNIFTCSLVPVGTLGLITNSLNVLVYATIGLHDSVSISFFSLSVSDLCFIILSYQKIITRVFITTDPEFRYNRYNRIVNLLGFYGGAAFDISVCVKAFIAVQRGCCVAFPFHVNRMFTKKRAAVVLLGFCLLIIACYVNDEFIKDNGFVDPFTNETYNEDLRVPYTIRYILNKTILVFGCNVLIFVSLVVIVYGMASTSKWRQSSAAERSTTRQTSTAWARTLSLIKLNGEGASNGGKGASNGEESASNGREGASNGGCSSQHKLAITKSQKPKKDPRELRVVKQVILISTLHLVSYTPVAIYAVVFNTLVSVYFTPYVLVIYMYMSEVNSFLGPFNAALNFFIYNKYNQKFHQTMMTIFKRINVDGL